MSTPLRQAALFTGTAFGMCLLLCLALPHWPGKPLVAALLPAVAMALVAGGTSRGAGHRSWEGLGLRRPTIGGVLVAVGLSAGVSSLSFAVAALLSVVSLPVVSPAELVAMVIRALVMTAAFTPVFLCEELGWRGYLLPRLATLTSGRRAAVAAGAVHACFHLPLLLLTTTYQSEGSRAVVIPAVMVTITAAGVAYAWSRWSSGSIWPVAAMHAAFNQAMGRWTAAVVATSPVALAYTTTETGLATMLLMLLLAGYLLTRRGPVFAAGARESQAVLAVDSRSTNAVARDDR